EPLPLGLVRESEGVEVHDRYPSGSGSDGERSIQGGHVRDGIVTGEGVVVDARPAAFLTRGLALLLDLVLLTVVVLLGVWMMSGVSLPTGYEGPIIIALLVTVMVVIPTAIETLTRGLSLGKLA